MEPTPASVSLYSAACSAVWAGELTPDERYEALGDIALKFVAEHPPEALQSDPEVVGFALVLRDLLRAQRRGLRFLLGETVKTASLAEVSDETLSGLLDRHARGDWGDVTDHDREANEAALDNGERLHSVYTNVVDGGGFYTRLWVITDAAPIDGVESRVRRLTTVMLPSDY